MAQVWAEKLKALYMTLVLEDEQLEEGRVEAIRESVNQDMVHLSRKLFKSFDNNSIKAGLSEEEVLELAKQLEPLAKRSMKTELEPLISELDNTVKEVHHLRLEAIQALSAFTSNVKETTEATIAAVLAIKRKERLEAVSDRTIGACCSIIEETGGAIRARNNAMQKLYSALLEIHRTSIEFVEDADDSSALSAIRHILAPFDKTE